MIKTLKFEIADKSTEIEANWDDARLYCFSLGEGWRLPTVKELEQIEKSDHDCNRNVYWSSEEYDDSLVFVCYFWDNLTLKVDRNLDYFFARAVRDIRK